MLCRLTMFGESHLFPLAVLHITQYAIPGLSTFRTVSESSLPSTSYFSNQNHFQVFFTPLSMALIWPGTTRSRSKISFLLDVILTDVWRCDCFVAQCETRSIHVRLVTNSHTHSTCTQRVYYCKIAGPDEDMTLDSFQGCIITWFSTQLACATGCVPLFQIFRPYTRLLMTAVCKRMHCLLWALDWPCTWCSRMDCVPHKARPCVTMHCCKLS